MAKRMTQIRYYSDNNPKNFPLNLKASDFALAIDLTKYKPVLKVNIQTLPGTTFYLNNRENPIIIGSTGAFELDVENTSTGIYVLGFTTESIKTIQSIEDAYLVISIVYRI